MRVCLVTGEYPPMRGGVGDYTREIAMALQALGVEVAVITSQRATPSPDVVSSHDGPKVFPSIEKWGYRSWSRIERVLTEFRPDVVHIQYQTAAYGMHPAINLFPLYMRRLKPRPLVAVTFHDLKVPYLFPKAGRVREVPAAVLARTSDLVVVTNEEDALLAVKRSSDGNTQSPGEWRSRFGGHPLRIIPIGSNIPTAPPPGYVRDKWRKRMGIGRRQILLSYFGFLGHSKGVDLLFDAMGELMARGHQLKLVMVGGMGGDSDPSTRDYAKSVRARADDPLFRSHVIWTGFTTAQEVSANLLASDICVLPFREGASLRHGTLVAAIAHGASIVTTESPASSSDHRYLPDGLWLRHRENAYLVPPNNAHALAEAILELMGDAELANCLRQGATKMAPMFDWANIAEQTLAAYNEVL